MDRPDVTKSGVTLMHGDAGRLELPDDSVDLIVTSPPYFGLRSYQDGGKHYEGQVGDEATPAEFIDALIRCTEEWVRVVKPSGSIWVNLGDKYNAYNGGRGEGTIQRNEVRQSAPRGGGLDVKDVRPKSLIGIPWRYAIRCIDDLGLILRAEVIWSKPNGLPESVTDRVRRSHEQWFHFTLNPRYYSAVDEIREQAEQARPQAARAEQLARRHGIGEEHRQALLARGLGDQGRSAATQSGTGKNSAQVLALAAEADAALGSYTREFTMTSQALGKLPGSVWTVPTEPLRVPDHLGIDHFAAFPTEFPRRIIQGWSPRGVCVECGEGRRPVVDSVRCVDGVPRQDLGVRKVGGYQTAPSGIGNWRVTTERNLTGEACACPEPTAPTSPGVVLDPFGGTGTTALVASALGRHGISNDLSRDYLRIAAWRTSDPKQIAKAKREPFTPSQEPIDGQLDILSMLEGEAS